MRLFAVLALLSSCSCPRASAPVAPEWPEFPASASSRAALIKEWTRRPVKASPEVTPDRVFLEGEKLGWSTLPAGEVQIVKSLPLPSGEGRGEGITTWLLFGTFHDSAGQIEAFRRLLQPGAFTHVALEQFRADGRWRAFEGSQTGDSADLTRFLASGDGWDELSRAHEEHDYTSWKYGYAQGVMDLVMTARALRIPALGCDLPDALLARAMGEPKTGGTPPGEDDEVMRLRELHCFLSLRDAGAKGRVAMLWGQAHVRSDGFRRFLPAGDQVLSLYAIGARHSADAPDELLRDRLILNDPVLVPLGDGEAALLLPDAHLGGQLERVRTRAAASSGVRVSATTPGTFKIRQESIELADAEVTVALEPGAYTYCFEDGGLRVVGSVLIPAGGEVELSFDVPARSTRMVEFAPSFP